MLQHQDRRVCVCFIALRSPPLRTSMPSQSSCLPHSFRLLQPLTVPVPPAHFYCEVAQSSTSPLSRSPSSSIRNNFLLRCIDSFFYLLRSLFSSSAPYRARGGGGGGGGGGERERERVCVCVSESERQRGKWSSLLDGGTLYNRQTDRKQTAGHTLPGTQTLRRQWTVCAE